MTDSSGASAPQKPTLEEFTAWFEKFELPERGSFEMSTFRKERSCETAACIIGWGVIAGALPGMEWSTHDAGLVEYKKLPGFSAIEAYFDLSEVETHYLFGETWDPEYEASDGHRYSNEGKTKDEMVSRLKAFIATRELIEDV